MILLLLVPKPHHKLLLIGSLVWIYLFQLVDSLACHFFFSFDFNIEKVFKSFEVEMRCIRCLEMLLIAYVLTESELFHFVLDVILPFNLHLHVIKILLVLGRVMQDLTLVYQSLSMF